MRLSDRLAAQGRWLFSFRSVVPLTLVPLVALALPQSRAAEEWLGPRGNLLFEWAAIGVGLAGLAFRCATVMFAPDGSSSRDTHRLNATTLNTTGTYSVVRHPLYLGAGLLWVGAVLSTRVWWLTAVVLLLYWLYIERIMLGEEQYLSSTFGDRFSRWASTTPAFVPDWSHWQRPVGPIQWKRLLSEHNGLLGLASSVTLFEFLEDDLHGGETWPMWYRDHPDLVWFLGVAIAVSITAITIRRWPTKQSRVAPHAALTP